MTKEEVLEFLREVHHPAKEDRDIVELGMVQAVEIISDGRDELGTGLDPIPDWRNTDREVLRRRIGDALPLKVGDRQVEYSPPSLHLLRTAGRQGRRHRPPESPASLAAAAPVRWQCRRRL